MNEDVDQKPAKSRSTCYATVSGIDTIYKEISSKIPVDPCTGGHYSVNKQQYGQGICAVRPVRESTFLCGTHRLVNILSPITCSLSWCFAPRKSASVFIQVTRIINQFW
jgi:hypothetical protein